MAVFHKDAPIHKVWCWYLCDSGPFIAPSTALAISVKSLGRIPHHLQFPGARGVFVVIVIGPHSPDRLRGPFGFGALLVAFLDSSHCGGGERSLHSTYSTCAAWDPIRYSPSCPQSTPMQLAPICHPTVFNTRCLCLPGIGVVLVCHVRINPDCARHGNQANISLVFAMLGVLRGLTKRYLVV